MEDLRKWGYEVDKVEQRLPIPGKFVTRDLFTIIDLLAMKPGHRLLAVQVTSRSNVNARVKKSEEKAKVWTSTGNCFQVWGYDDKCQRRVMTMQQNGKWMDRVDLVGGDEVEQ